MAKQLFRETLDSIRGAKADVSSNGHTTEEGDIAMTSETAELRVVSETAERKMRLAAAENETAEQSMPSPSVEASTLSSAPATGHHRPSYNMPTCPQASPRQPSPTIRSFASVPISSGNGSGDGRRKRPLDSEGLFQLGYDAADVGLALVATRGKFTSALEMLEAMQQSKLGLNAPKREPALAPGETLPEASEPPSKRQKQSDAATLSTAESLMAFCIGGFPRPSQDAPVESDFQSDRPQRALLTGEHKAVGDANGSHAGGDLFDSAHGGGVIFDGATFVSVEQPPTPGKRRAVTFNVSVKETRCSCSRSGCLKGYCVCFAAGKTCSPEVGTGCGCTGCENDDSTDERQAKRAALLQPLKVKRAARSSRTGCTCKHSGCRKRYCECFKAGIKCVDKCKCLGCKNCKTQDDGNETDWSVVDGYETDWSVIDDSTPCRPDVGRSFVGGGPSTMGLWIAEDAAAVMVDLCHNSMISSC